MNENAEKKPVKRQNQHYVPQFLLRNFSHTKKGDKEHYVYAYDKHTDKKFKPNTAGIAAERDFYDIQNGDEVASLEESFSSLEHRTKEAIDKIINTRSLSTLTDEDKAWLCIFVAAQYMRVKKQREVMLDLNDQMAEHLRKMGADLENVQGFQILNAEDIKRLSMQSMPKELMEIARYVGQKTLFLHEFTDELYISDNPVVLSNTKDFGPYGNIGFAVRGIEIYFPIHRNLALVFWCTSLQDEFETGVNSAKDALQKARAVALLSNKSINKDAEKALLDTIAKFDALKDSAIRGEAIKCSSENAMFLNSLQVGWSHRYVFSADGNFDLVERMIADNPANREGVKMKLS